MNKRGDSLTTKKQADQICELKAIGMKHRDISEQVFGVRTKASSTGPRILTFDIETAPNIGCHWGLWQQNIGLGMLMNEWSVMSWSAKWFGDNEEDVIYEDNRHEWDGSAASILDRPDKDRELLKGMWRLLDEADIVITQNGKKFDVKKLNARFIMMGMTPPSSYKHIDTLQIAKRHFAFTSNKLEWMTDKLCVNYKKLNHGKFAGFSLWKECMAGNPEAWDEMEEYNRYDVLSLEELVVRLAPWSNQLPQFDLYYTGNDNMHLDGLPYEFVEYGYAYTNLSKFQRYRCLRTGVEKRGRTNLLTKEKRQALRMNIL